MNKNATLPGLHDPLAVARNWSAEGRKIALATVVETWGSAPRPVGCHLVIDGDGNFEGSVSGGCVEGAVISEAMEVISEGKPRLLEFGVEDEVAWKVGLSCGGRIRVYVEEITGVPACGQLDQINEAGKNRQAICRAINMDSGDAVILSPGLGKSQSDALQNECEAHFHSGKSAIVRPGDESEMFLNIYVPAPRLIVIGAVHISQALSSMARTMGLEVTIIDPRSAFATSARFAGSQLHTCWPDEIWAKINPDAFTALVALSHDPKIDDFPLIEALKAQCFYVGALGSRKTHGRRLERLRAAGISEKILSRIHAPVGLDIGAASPQEIAVSILAQIIEALRKPKTNPNT